MIKKLFIGLLGLVICGLVFNQVCLAALATQTPAEDSPALGIPEPPPAPKVISQGRVSLQGKQLTVLDSPYIIKGVTWQPATRASSFFYNDPAGFINWLKSEFTPHYQADIELMNQMKVNTVRVYTDLGENPAVYGPILDKLDEKGIKVIMTVASGQEDINPFYNVYTDYNLPPNNFIPSGFMPDAQDLTLAANSKESFYSGEYSTKITYTNNSGRGWAGIYWQSSENNWGQYPGHDLRGYDKVKFKIRGTSNGVNIKFKVGGIGYGGNCNLLPPNPQKPYPDSTCIDFGPITLTTNWQEYTIPLSGDLSNINGGFAIIFEAVSGSTSNATVYLDDIVYYNSDTANQQKYKQIVDRYKSHPAILMWVLGNEWNINNYYDREHLKLNLILAARATEEAAHWIHENDSTAGVSNHPVSSILGDIFYRRNIPGVCPVFDEVGSDIPEILKSCPSVDIWGLNIFRGPSFLDRTLNKTIFQQWQDITSKPFYFSEFGTDSFRTLAYTKPFSKAPTCTLVPNPTICDLKVNNVWGYEDRVMQSDFDIGLWWEIKDHLSAINPSELCLGGLVFEFNDELWKIGNDVIGFSGLVDCNGHSYDDYNKDGFYMGGAHPDYIANEEYFGLVDANRNPKVAFNDLTLFYNTLGTGLNNAPTIYPIGSQTGYDNQIFGFNVAARDIDNDNITLSAASRLPTGASFPTKSGKGKVIQTFTWVYPPAGAFNMTFTVTDGKTSNSQTMTIYIKKPIYPPPIVAN